MIDPGEVTLFLCGDVMTGRGVDQILPHPSLPHLHERFLKSAREYVALAERVNGPIPQPVSHPYVWGEALGVLERVRPDARIINLETSVTTSEDAVFKGINYRMHPANVPVLTAAAVDCCVLANNHVLDWGESGLLDTLRHLEQAGISAAGAGRDRSAARAPAVLEVAGGSRVLVFSCGAGDSGIPSTWDAGPTSPGIHRLPDWSDATVDDFARLVSATKRSGDLAVASIHWGGNWGFGVPSQHRCFAHALIDRAGIDVVHGHSSHHPKGVEVYQGHPIFYGCGDFLNDYEGISRYEEFRTDLVLMCFPSLEKRTGKLTRLEMIPLQIRRFRLSWLSPADVGCILGTLDRECSRFGHRVVLRDGVLVLDWP